jgi:hypothetical protein
MLHSLRCFTDFSLKCSYNRERKKRGKASRKDLARQKAAAGSDENSNGLEESSAPKTVKKVEQKPLPAVDTPTAPPKPAAKAKSHVRRLSTILPSPHPTASSAGRLVTSMPQPMRRDPSHQRSISQPQHVQPSLVHSPPYKSTDVSPSLQTPIDPQMFSHGQVPTSMSHTLTNTPPYPQDGPESMGFGSDIDQAIFGANQLHSPSYVHHSISPSLSDHTQTIFFTDSVQTSPYDQAPRTATFPLDHNAMMSFGGAQDFGAYHSPTYVDNRNFSHPHQHQLPTPQPQLSISDDGSISISLQHQQNDSFQAGEFDLNVFDRYRDMNKSNSNPSRSPPSNAIYNHSMQGVPHPGNMMRRATIAHIPSNIQTSNNSSPSISFDGQTGHSSHHHAISEPQTSFPLLSPTSQHEHSGGPIQVTTSDSGLSGLLLSTMDDGSSNWLALPSPPPTSYPPTYGWSA